MNAPLTLTNPTPRGRRRVASGQVGEDFAEAAIKACELRGLCRIFRVANDFKVVGRTARKGAPLLLCVPRKKSGPDYVGVLANGRLVALEVKRDTGQRLKSGRLSAPSLPLALFEQHQLDDLRRIDEMGGLAFALLVHGCPNIDGGFYLVPWRLLNAAIKGDKASVHGDELLDCLVPKSKLLLDGIS